MKEIFRLYGESKVVDLVMTMYNALKWYSEAEPIELYKHEEIENYQEKAKSIIAKISIISGLEVSEPKGIIVSSRNDFVISGCTIK